MDDCKRAEGSLQHVIKVSSREDRIHADMPRRFLQDKIRFMLQRGEEIPWLTDLKLRLSEKVGRPIKMDVDGRNTGEFGVSSCFGPSLLGILCSDLRDSLLFRCSGRITESSMLEGEDLAIFSCQAYSQAGQRCKLCSSLKEQYAYRMVLRCSKLNFALTWHLGSEEKYPACLARPDAILSMVRGIFAHPCPTGDFLAAIASMLGFPSTNSFNWKKNHTACFHIK
eukprot:747031-Hanusia_phi.AAC.2